MKYSFITIILILFFILDAFPQRQAWQRDRHYLAFGLGASGFMGDLGGADRIGTQGLRDFDFAAVRPSLMFGYRYFLLSDLAFSAHLTFTYVAGDDKNTNELHRNNRNINFRSPIIEFAPKLQYYFISYNRLGAQYRRATGARVRRNLEFSAYVFTGVAGFYFNPQGYFDAENYFGSIATDDLPSNGWYNLRPLFTEGQGYFPTREKYSSVSVAIPFGIGALMHINRDMSVGFEFGFRKTFTDYIDDVSRTYVDPSIYQDIFSEPFQIALAEYFANPTINTLDANTTAPGQQRGNPYNTDAYMFTMFTFYYRIPNFMRPSRVWGN